MWNVKTNVTLGATGTISKSFREYLSNVYLKASLHGAPFHAPAHATLTSAGACFVAQESRISCSMPSPVQTLLRGTCVMSLGTLSKTLDDKFSGETEPECKPPWRSQNG